MSSSDTLSWSGRAPGGKGTQLFWRLPDVTSGLPTMDYLRRRYSKFYVGEDELALVAKGGVRTEIANPGVYPLEKDVTEVIFLPKGKVIRDWGLSESDAPAFSAGDKSAMNGQMILRIADPALFVKEVIAGGGYTSDAVAFEFLMFHVKKALGDFIAEGKLTREGFEGMPASDRGRSVAERAGAELASLGLGLESVSAYLGAPAAPPPVPAEGELTRRVSLKLPWDIDGAADALSSLFPGYGYRLRQARERTDQAVRQKVAGEILQAERSLERLATFAFKARQRAVTEQVKELNAELRNLRQTVEHAESGESPFFGKQMKMEEQITEHDVEAVIRFDALFLDTVNTMKNTTDKLLEQGVGGDEKGLLQSLQGLVVAVANLRNAFLNRRDFLSSVGRMLEGRTPPAAQK